MASAGGPTDRSVCLDQAELLLEGAYVHLALKRAMHGVDPLQRVKLLRGRSDALTDDEFRRQLLREFLTARDMHTVFTFSDGGEKVAVLPFLLDRCFVAGRPVYLVTELEFGFSHPQFVSGVEVTHWNGVPIGRVVDAVADRTGAGNAAARSARGLVALTQRPLRYMERPDESWVVVTYLNQDQRQDIRFTWQTVTVPSPAAPVEEPDRAPRAATRGLDSLVDVQQRTRQRLFAPALPDRTAEDPAARRAEPAVRSALPGLVEVGTLEEGARHFGFLRIRSFDVPSIDAFVAEVARLAGLMPPDGLIVDLRGNGGGAIQAAERLLQLFTPRRVEPERFHFVNTPFTARLVRDTPWLSDWAPSVLEATEVGSVLSDGFPVEQGHVERCNSIGQVYVGPVVAVVDALCYSATESFAAGFQDHAIGPVLGVADSTGGGGANAWDHAFLLSVLGPGDVDLQPLPPGAGMSVAIRQARRVGPRSGALIEDFGVRPDVVHRPTRTDLLNRDFDLKRHAAELLASLPPRRFDVDVIAQDSGLVLRIDAVGIDRVDVTLDGRPHASIDIDDGTHDVPVHGDELRATTVRADVTGFSSAALVARRVLVLGRPPSG